MKTDNIRCHTTNKHCYTSEAKALRDINKFDRLRRAYFCNDCEHWHTTKIGTNLAIEHNIIEPITKKKKITDNRLQKRLDFLLKCNK